MNELPAEGQDGHNRITNKWRSSFNAAII